MAKEKLLPLVVIEWFDITEFHGWHDVTDEFEIPLCVTVGWVIQKTKKKIVLTSSLGLHSEDDGYGTVHAIPMGTVKSIRRVG